MNYLGKLLLVLLAIGSFGCTPDARRDSAEPPAAEAPPAPMESARTTAQSLHAAIAAIPGRSADDAARDAGRKPAEVLEFLGLAPGMTVMDVFAAGGWYSEVLSGAVGSDGRVLIQNPPRMLEFRDGVYAKQLSARLDGGRLANTERLDVNIDELEVAAGSLDMAITALNFHDMVYLFAPDAAAGALAAIHGMLKPGGVLGIIDHAGSPDADNASLHRIDPQIARDMAMEAGFVVEAESDLLHDSGDDLTLQVFDPAVRGKTHRFVLRLRKP